MSTDYRAFVIGAGPGGYVAALRLAQLGIKTGIADRTALGGTCLNIGCIPSKALITAAKTYEKIGRADKMGITVKGLEIDMNGLQKWKQSIVKRLTTGVGALLKGNGVDVFMGNARFRDRSTVDIVDDKGKTTTVRSQSFIIATGSRPIEIPGFEIDEKNVLSSTGALDLDQVPRSLLVIGGGYIGLEIGTLYAKLGSKVTVVEMLDSLLPGFDPELTDVVHKKLLKSGVEVHTGARAVGYSKKRGGLEVELQISGKSETRKFDKILVTVGRRPVTDGLDLDRAGLKTDAKGFLSVNERLQTAAPGIYAIGDVIGNPMLAHKASKEGEVAAEVIAGKNVVLDYRSMPAVVFTDPEISSVGLMEHEARAKGLDITVGKYNFVGLGRALTTDAPEGFVKVIAAAGTREILGVQVVGAEASELIAEAGLALEFGAEVDDLALTVHAHPTLAEALPEAARAAVGEAIHALKKR
jgi:dihydrolipoamide dehydrogenase